MDKDLDQFDIDILKHLEDDGKKPFSQIAEELNISNTMVHQRVTKLRKEGILRRHSIVIDEKKLGYEWGAFSGVIISEARKSEDIIEDLRKVPEVTECYHISGSYTLFIRIVAKSSEHMREILYDKIESISGIVSTESMVDFGCAFKRNPPLMQ